MIRLENVSLHQISRSLYKVLCTYNLQLNRKYHISSYKMSKHFSSVYKSHGV